MASKNQVISEYKKAIFSQLSAKFEKAQANAKSSDSGKNENTKQQGLSEQPTTDTELEKFNDQIKELEMELAQTKLALVETKCRNQELTHQIVLIEEKLERFAKTLYSIKETAASEPTQPQAEARSSTPASEPTQLQAEARSSPPASEPTQPQTEARSSPPASEPTQPQAEARSSTPASEPTKPQADVRSSTAASEPTQPQA